MSFKKEIRLAGSGGQGLVLAGIILAEAAILFEGLNALQTQSYGPEARGGASKSEVIISNDDIDYPKCEELDILLALTQKSHDTYNSDLKKGGIMVVDSDLVGEVASNVGELYRIPFTAIARDKVGKVFVANIVALGALVEIMEFVNYSSLEKAVLRRVPKGTEEINKKALNAGREAMRELIKQSEENK